MGNASATVARRYSAPITSAMDNGGVNRRNRLVLFTALGPVLAVALLVAVAAPTAQSVSFIDNLLQQQRFSAADRRALAAGQAVVKTLDTSIRRELAHFGIVHIDAPPSRFVERFRDIDSCRCRASDSVW